MLPYALSNFPAVQTYSSAEFQFNKASDLGDWDFYGSGHPPPDTLYDMDGGAVQLGGVDATSGSYMQMQQIGNSIKCNRLGKTYTWLFKVQLSSATLASCHLGAFVSNSNFLNTNITDGIGFYTTGTNWNAFMAYGSATQFTTYTQQLAVKAVDTDMHTFGIRYITDGSTLGAGQLSWWYDGNQVGATQTATTAALPYNQYLRASVGVANGSAVAQNAIVAYAGYSDQR